MNFLHDIHESTHPNNATIANADLTGSLSKDVPVQTNIGSIFLKLRNIAKNDMRHSGIKFFRDLREKCCPSSGRFSKIFFSKFCILLFTKYRIISRDFPKVAQSIAPSTGRPGFPILYSLRTRDRSFYPKFQRE